MTSGCRDTETDSAAAPDDEATTEDVEEVPAGEAEDDVAAGAAEGPAEAAAPSSTSMTIPKGQEVPHQGFVTKEKLHCGVRRHLRSISIFKFKREKNVAVSPSLNSRAVREDIVLDATFYRRQRNLH